MKGKFKLNHLIVHLILLVGVIVVVFPFAWMILTSFKTSGEAMKIPPTIFPEKFVTTAYHTIVTSAIPFATVYMNTIITTVVTTLVQIVFCSMAGYAFGRIEFPFKNAIFILVLSVLMVPGQSFRKDRYYQLLLPLFKAVPADSYKTESDSCSLSSRQVSDSCDGGIPKRDCGSGAGCDETVCV